MEKKRKTTVYRERLDKSLVSPDLTNEEKIKALVKNRLLHSSQHEVEGYSESVLEKRTMEVSNFLEMLRSTSLNQNEAPKVHDTSHPEWKLKQDTEEFRVMYREGIQGTPFHTLLVEGYVDGPVDECLCVSWESELYKKWWPQIMIPTFKLTSNEIVQKVCDGEHISLLRVKVPWPLSSREALVHYFEFECVQQDLVIVLVNTISDVESINIETHGFSKDGIPEAKDVVRIDVVGGFAIQKVTPGRSYFRTIARMDMKLDFVPPALINFIARQLIGSGFRLYEKIVSSSIKNDDDFRKALADPLYVGIRKAFFSSDEPNGVMGQEDELVISDTFSLPEDHSQEGMEDVEEEEENHGSESSEKNVLPTARKTFGEIVEEESSDNDTPEAETETSMSKEPALSGTHDDDKCYTKFPVSPKVEQALGTLDRVIDLIQKSRVTSGSIVEQGEKDSKPSQYPNGHVSEKQVVPEPKNSSSNQNARSSETNTQTRESNLHKIAPESPEPKETRLIASPTNVTTEAPIPEKIEKEHGIGHANVIGNNSLARGAKSGQRTKQRLCCF